MAEAPSLVLDVLEAKLLRLGVFAQVIALCPDGRFTPEVIAHDYVAPSMLTARPRWVEQLVMESPDILGRQLARRDAGPLQECLAQPIA